MFHQTCEAPVSPGMRTPANVSIRRMQGRGFFSNTSVQSGQQRATIQSPCRMRANQWPPAIPFSQTAHWTDATSMSLALNWLMKATAGTRPAVWLSIRLNQVPFDQLLQLGQVWAAVSCLPFPWPLVTHFVPQAGHTWRTTVVVVGGVPLDAGTFTSTNSDLHIGQGIAAGAGVSARMVGAFVNPAAPPLVVTSAPATVAAKRAAMARVVMVFIIMFFLFVPANRFRLHDLLTTAG